MKQTILFLHIPKSAGTTLTTCLTENYYNKEDAVVDASPNERLRKFYEGGIFYYPEGFYKSPAENVPDYSIPFLSQPGLQVVTGHFSYGVHKHIQSESGYITMLRDPVERVISLYYHLLATNMISEQISLDKFLDGVPIDGWLEDLADWYPVKPLYDENEIRRCSMCIVDNDQTRRISGMEPPFGECDEAMFEQACRNITERFIMVGLTERFDESLVMLGCKLGWKKEVRYVPKLKNRAKPHLTKVPDHLIAKAELRNHWDRKLYEFACTLFDKGIEELGPRFSEKINQFSAANKNYIEKSDNAKDWDIGVC